VVPGVAKHGLNDFHRYGYGGPCPTEVLISILFQALRALDTYINLNAGATKSEVLDAIRGHVLTEEKLTGYYRR